MANVRFDPFRGFEGLARKMNNLVSDMDKGFNVEYGNFAPRIDIHEDEKSLYLYAEMPGLKKQDIKVTVNDENVLIIKGKKDQPEYHTEKEGEEKVLIRAERRFGEFTRSFMLPDNIDTESIEAKFEDGVLNVQFAKKEPEKPKEKEITIS